MRFVSKDAASGCWLWVGAIDRQGYGRVGVEIGPGRFSAQRAHRVAYGLFVGPIPEGEGYHGTVVCHRCDVPHCVNPEHLFLGTQQENLRDMTAKGRRNTRTLRHHSATTGDT